MAEINKDGYQPVQMLGANLVKGASNSRLRLKFEV
jgi:hypothetical protein